MVNKAEPTVSYTIKNDKRFSAALKRASKTAMDQRFAWPEIARVVKKGQTKNFILKGSGQYEPLTKQYKRRKEREIGTKPILVFSGRLRDSVLKYTTDSILVMKKDEMFIGTKDPKAAYHQSDRPRSKMPLRKFMFIDEPIMRNVLDVLGAEKLRQMRKAGFKTRGGM